MWKQPSGKTLIFHLGGNGTFNAAMRYHVGERTLVVYTSNVSEFHDPNYPVPAIERMLEGEAVQMPPVVTPLASNQLSKYVGRYRSDSGSVLSAEAKGPFLKVEAEGQEALSFVTSGRWQMDAELEALNARIAEVVERSRTRKYEALLKEYGQEDDSGGADGIRTLFWQKRHAHARGLHKDTNPGTVPSRGRAFIEERSRQSISPAAPPIANTSGHLRKDRRRSTNFGCTVIELLSGIDELLRKFEPAEGNRVVADLFKGDDVARKPCDSCSRGSAWT